MARVGGGPVDGMQGGAVQNLLLSRAIVVCPIGMGLMWMMAVARIARSMPALSRR